MTPADLTEANPFLRLRIVASSHIAPVAKLRVNDDVPMSDSCRANINQWLLKAFGTKEVGYMFDDSLVVSNAVAARIRATVVRATV